MSHYITVNNRYALKCDRCQKSFCPRNGLFVRTTSDLRDRAILNNWIIYPIERKDFCTTRCADRFFEGKPKDGSDKK